MIASLPTLTCTVLNTIWLDSISGSDKANFDSIDVASFTWTALLSMSGCVSEKHLSESHDFNLILT